jgi:hypothetical protein
MRQHNFPQKGKLLWRVTTIFATARPTGLLPKESLWNQAVDLLASFGEG